MPRPLTALRRFAATLLLSGAAALAVAQPIQITSTRVWPAPDYTRITLESQRPIQHTLLTLKNPDRVVLDLEGVDITATLNGLAEKIHANDPYVKAVRVGRFKTGIARLVLDLKSEVRAQAFAIQPIADYGHRLVLDLHALNPVDPLLALTGAPAPSPAPVSELAAPPAPVTAAVPEPDRTARAEPEKPARAGPRSQRLITVAIDAGHGGEDPGARGRGGTLEKHVTLAIAQKVKERLDEEPNMRGVLVRTGDYFVPLQARVAKARRVQADLFVSVHADAFIKPHARGSSVFALSESGATSAAARWLAKKENDADLIGGVNLDVKDQYLKQTLLDLSQTATINDSLKLGKSVLGELGGINTLHKNHVEQAGFAVLKAPDIPSILVETAFISNPEEERRLKSDAYQNKMAEAIVKGIKRYFEKNPPLARERIVMNP